MKQKKMALINDVTGFGRCSIAVMAPIISAMKIQAVTVPTAILSTHTQFPEFFFDDYTPKMREYIQTYKNLNMEFDGIATGFLGSKEQVDIVIDFIKTFKREGSVILIDPVMGDYGELYKTYTPIPFHKKQIMNYIYSKGEDPQIVMVDRIGEDRSGTGDVISSVIAGMYMNGHTFYDSVRKAAEFATKCIKYCQDNNVPSHWGLCFEMYMKDLMEA